MANKIYHPIRIRIRHIAYAFLLLSILFFIDHFVDPSVGGEGRLWSPMIMIASAIVFLVVDYWSNRKRPDGDPSQNAEADDKDDPYILRANDDPQSEILRLKARVHELEQTLGDRTATDVPESLNGDVAGASSLDPDFLEELETSDPKGSDPGIAGDFTPIGGSKAQSTQSEPNGSETQALKKDNEDS